MNQNRRLILNVLASHGRSLLVLACSFLTSRWALRALGVENYGLLGLISGLIVFATVINTSLSTAICRFFAYSIGTSSQDCDGVEECRRWFSISVAIHLALSVLMVLIAYPLLAWLIVNFIDISEGRIHDCLVVNRWVCLSAFFSIFSVPFRAMFVAKQNIVEITVYNVVQTLAYTVALFYMASHPGDWFVCVAIWLFIQNSSVNILTMVRSFLLFPECRLKVQYICDIARFKQLAFFSGWELVGGYSFALRNQGLSVLVNKCYGALMNASFSVAFSLAGRAQIFANEVNSAFAPVISTTRGRGDIAGLEQYSISCSKYSCCLVSLVALPIVMAMDDFLVFWLTTPPPGAAQICAYMCVSYVIDKLTSGQHLSVIAEGNNRSLQMSILAWYAMTVPFAYLGYATGMGVESVGAAFALSNVGVSASRLYYAKRLVGLSVGGWFRRVLSPLAIAALLAVAISGAVRSLLDSGFIRMLCTVASFEMVFGFAIWRCLLSDDERIVVCKKVSSRLGRMLRR